MSTVLSHSVVPVALSTLFPEGALSAEVIALGMACAAVPDLDVAAFALGIRYESPFGHRGFSHSLCFAALLAGGLSWSVGGGATAFAFWFLATLSHPLVDALTDGGCGVALLSPFSNRRFFFPWRPLKVPPIGIRPFFSRRGWEVLLSELLWIWLPCGLVVLLKQAV